MIPQDIQWPLLATEIGLIFFAIGMMVLDIFVRDDEKKGQTTASIAMVGVAALGLFQASRWGIFGSTFHASFVQDGVSYFFKILFCLAAFFTLFLARSYQSKLKRGHSEFTLLILFSLVGMLFLASANDFLLFFIAIEILSVSLYIMTAYLKDQNRSIEAGVKYIVLGALSTAILLYGISFIYGTLGSTNYSEILKKYDQMYALGQAPPIGLIFGIILVISSLGFKIAAVPFHLWVPDIYEGAPAPVTSFLATGSKAAGFIALIRLMMTVFAPFLTPIGTIFSVLAALTIIYGNLGAIPQTNIKRLLGYSSIGHAGYLLIGLVAFTSSGNEAVLFYLLSYLFSTAGAFLVIVAVTKAAKTDNISEFAGLGQRSPVLAAGMLLALLSLAGVPPLAGFFAKFYLLWAGVKAGYLWLVVIGVINVVTSLYYYLKIVKAMYLEKPAVDAPILNVSFSEKAMQYFAMLSIVLLGIFPGPVIHLAQAAFAVIQ